MHLPANSPLKHSTFCSLVPLTLSVHALICTIINNSLSSHPTQLDDDLTTFEPESSEARPQRQRRRKEEQGEDSKEERKKERKTDREKGEKQKRKAVSSITHHVEIKQPPSSVLGFCSFLPKCSALPNLSAYYYPLLSLFLSPFLSSPVNASNHNFSSITTCCSIDRFSSITTRAGRSIEQRQVRNARARPRQVRMEIKRS